MKLFKSLISVLFSAALLLFTTNSFAIDKLHFLIDGGAGGGSRRGGGGGGTITTTTAITTTHHHKVKLVGPMSKVRLFFKNQKKNKFNNN